MASSSALVRICQGLGITASSFLAGSLYYLSTIAIPAVLTAPSPSLLLKQWHTLFRRGKKLGPALALFGTLNYLHVAWTAYNNNSTYERGLWKLYVTAAVCTGANVP
ncbi:MAG: hypothetical protein Q9208_008809, partial [Pyrenodesmia sp. 3 TL-2023]